MPNILMTGFLQTLEQRSKRKRGGRFLQQQVELLISLESILLGIYLFVTTLKCSVGSSVVYLLSCLSFSAPLILAFFLSVHLLC